MGKPGVGPGDAGEMGAPAMDAGGAAKIRVYSLGPAGATGPGAPAEGEGVVKTWVALAGGTAGPPAEGKAAGGKTGDGVAGGAGDGGVPAIPGAPNI
ncbi:MAG: hypothetical protein ACK55F_02645 [Acidobacteriota bacterium]